MDEIFEGPALDHGFIDDNELEKANREDVRAIIVQNQSGTPAFCSGHDLKELISLCTERG